MGHPGVGRASPPLAYLDRASTLVLIPLRMAALAGPGPVLSEGGDSGSRFVYFDANDPIVAALPFAEWQPAPAGAAAIPMLQISSPALTRILIPRTKVGRASADQTAARAISPMTFSLQNTSWERIKTEYAVSGAFANVHRDLQTWEDCARELVLSTPANLELVAADWRNTPAPTVPRGTGAANKEVWEPSSVGGNRRTRGREAPTGRVATGCRALNQQSALIPPSRRSCRAASHRPWPS